MKRTTALVLALALSSAAGVSAADDSPQPELAVLRGENRVHNTWWDEEGAERAQNALISRLSQNAAEGGVMARLELVKIFADKRLWITGELSPAGAIRIGRELRVRYLVVPTLVEFGTGARGLGKNRGRKLLGLGGPKNFRTEIALRLIDTKSGATVWSDSRRAQTALEELLSSPGDEGRLVDEAVFERSVLPLLEDMAGELSAALALPPQEDEPAADVPAENSGR